MWKPQTLRLSVGTFSEARMRGLTSAVVFIGFLLAAGVSLFTLHPTEAVDLCPGKDRAILIQNGDTLSVLAQRYHTTMTRLQTENHLADPNLIYAGTHLCVSGERIAAVQQLKEVSATYNPYPSSQCTWWADARYYQIHGSFVPWTTNAYAWQWTARAYDFGWHISGAPRLGSIIDLQPGVQGASSLGHVAVVERVLANKHVITSNLNWYPYPAQVTNIEFAPGKGVTFLWND